MDITGKLPRWAILLGILAGGLVLVWLPNYFVWAWDYGVTKGLGEAIAIAAVLGFTIDRWFREDFAKDVFFAAFGELLRPEFREEMRWLTTFRWLSTKCVCRVKLEEMPGEIVKFTLEVTKDTENTSSSSDKISNAIGIDEWGFRDYPSIIEQCSLRMPDGKMIAGVETEKTSHHMTWTTDEVSVDPKAKVGTFSRSVEYRRRNDIHVLAFRHPTKDPEVEMDVPSSLTASVGFTHKGKMETEPFTGRKMTLHGTLLPNQVIIFRWYPKE